MKRKFLFAAITTGVFSGAMSCWTLAQQNPNPLGQTAAQTVAGVNFLYNAETPVQKTYTTNNSGTSDVIFVSPQSIGAQEAVARQFATVPNNGHQVLRTIVQRYLAADDASAKEQITAELKQLVDKQFDVLQDAKSFELKKLEEQLAKLKELHSKRAKQKEQIVADRVQQIVREADGLGWGMSENAGSLGGGTLGYATIAPNAVYPAYPAAASTPSISTTNLAPARASEPTISPSATAR